MKLFNRTLTALLLTAGFMATAQAAAIDETDPIAAPSVLAATLPTDLDANDIMSTASEKVHVACEALFLNAAGLSLPDQIALPVFNGLSNYVAASTAALQDVVSSLTDYTTQLQAEGVKSTFLQGQITTTDAVLSSISAAVTAILPTLTPSSVSAPATGSIVLPVTDLDQDDAVGAKALAVNSSITTLLGTEQLTLSVPDSLAEPFLQGLLTFVSGQMSALQNFNSAVTDYQTALTAEQAKAVLVQGEVATINTALSSVSSIVAAAIAAATPAPAPAPVPAPDATPVSTDVVPATN
ncbi:MAG: hypothetical protein WCG05_00390 [Alphaproteobacteria bacterium]